MIENVFDLMQCQPRKLAVFFLTYHVMDFRKVRPVERATLLLLEVLIGVKNIWVSYDTE